MDKMELYLKQCDAFEEPALGKLNFQKWEINFYANSSLFALFGK